MSLTRHTNEPTDFSANAHLVLVALKRSPFLWVCLCPGRVGRTEEQTGRKRTQRRLVRLLGRLDDRGGGMGPAAGTGAKGDVVSCWTWIGSGRARVAAALAAAPSRPTPAGGRTARELWIRSGRQVGRESPAGHMALRPAGQARTTGGRALVTWDAIGLRFHRPCRQYTDTGDGEAKIFVPRITPEMASKF